MKSLIKAIKTIAKENPEGFTIELKTLKHVSSGFVVAYKETQNSFDTKGLKKVLKHAEKNAGIVGGWFNTENGKFYFDSIKIFTNLNEAVEFGKQNEQIAIFDLDKLNEIRL